MSSQRVPLSTHGGASKDSSYRRRVSRSHSGGGHIVGRDSHAQDGQVRADGLVTPSRRSSSASVSAGGGQKEPEVGMSSSAVGGGRARRDSGDVTASDSESARESPCGELHPMGFTGRAGDAPGQVSPAGPSERRQQQSAGSARAAKAGVGEGPGEGVAAGIPPSVPLTKPAVAEIAPNPPSRAHSAPQSSEGESKGACGDAGAVTAAACRRMGPGASTEFTWEEVRRHRYSDSCWLVARGVVYDVTSFLEQHPVGAEAILRRAGRDNTEDLDFHSRGAQAMWDRYRIGVVEGQGGGCVVS